MIWFTSDTHFNHANVIGYCNRPYANTKEMDQALIENWNKCVKKNEHIYVLGDFAMCSNEYRQAILAQLNGYKILVKGNHDKDTKVMLEVGFDKVIENDRIKVGNHHVLVSHFPYHPVTQHVTVGKKIFQKIDAGVDGRYLHKRILDDGTTPLLHGHVHTAYKIKPRQINVGVDVWNYKPVSHEQILRIIENGYKI